MNVLIATGIFEPEAGGPATYAAGLARGLVAEGHTVTVLTYAPRAHADVDATYPFRVVRVERRGKISNRVRFFFAAYSLIRAVDVCYTLDWFAAGVPFALAARLRRKTYLARVGGDYLWEQKYLESGAPPVTLAAFYERGMHRRLSYRPASMLIHWVLRGASHVVFNSDKQRALYERFYGLTHTSTVWNPLPNPVVVHREKATQELVFWGRHIVMKNLDTLIEGFARAKIPATCTLTLIGDGPQKTSLKRLVRERAIESRMRFEPGMSLQNVLSRVKDCRALILPSWTDISPNQVCESMMLGLPALVTKENYLPFGSSIPEMIDPASADDIARKIEMIADDEKYQAFAAKWKEVSFAHDWKDVVREHMSLFGTLKKEV